jgi:membrane protein implicated in regulation of membrane protease activity
MRQGYVAIIALVLACSGGLVPGLLGQAEEATAARVEQIWAEREKRVKAYRVVWSETTTYPRGSTFLNPRAAPEELPPADLTLKAACKMVIAGQKSRYEYDGEWWSTRSRGVGPAVKVVTFDGGRSANTILKSTLIDNPQVTLKKASVSPNNDLTEFLPIWLTARASVASRVLPIGAYRSTGRRDRVNNRICQEFSRVSGAVRDQIFLDPERDYQVVRNTQYVNDKLWTKLEVTYQPEPTLGWVPATWDVVTCTPGGAIGVSKRCVVTEFVTNIDVPESDFEPVLPIGARVIDLTAGKEMHSAVLPTGERGREVEFVPGRSKVPSYETLMAQPPQRGFWARAWPWALAGGGLLVVGVVGVAVWRARRNRDAPAGVNREET